MTMRIVSFRGQAFAYSQDYEVHSWPQAHLADLPWGSRAVDSFIGPPSMLGRGHGARYLRLLGERLWAEGAPLVVIDPNVDNRRARRAYQKAGFFCERRVATEVGLAVLMVFERNRSAI